MDKDKQKQLLVEVMNEDHKNGLYKEQTAVEWLVKERNKWGFTTLPDLLQAKQMEQDQREKDYNEGYEEGYTDGRK